MSDKFNSMDSAYAAGFRDGVEHVEKEGAEGAAAPGAEAPITLASIAKMSEAEINARWQEISAVLEEKS